MLQLNHHYTRTSPDGIESDIHITNQRFLEYHRELQIEGFEYKEKKVIHKSESVCLSCEG